MKANTSSYRIRIVLAVCVCWILSLVPGVQAQTVPVSDLTGVVANLPSDQDLAQTNDRDLAIGAGDLISVSVLGAPDFDRQFRVSGKGSVALPFIGNVQVAGLTVGNAETLIAQRLADGGYFNNPRVSLLVKEYATQGISVLGEVRKPGIYELLGNRTLLDAISTAGGTTEKASKSVSITHRDQPDTPTTVSLPGAFDPSGPRNVELRPGDIVVVAKAGIVYVVGDVRQPTGIVLENQSLTVLQAIAMAQGTNPNAALDKSRLIRKGTDGPTEISIPLKQMLAAKSPDVKLLPDDIIFVPNSLAKSATRRSLEIILQTVSGIAIYH